MIEPITASRSDWEDLKTERLDFRALHSQQPGMYSVDPIYAPSDSITGQTSLNRFPKLFQKPISCVQKFRPYSKKRVGCFPVSSGAEAATVVARAKQMGVLDRFEIEGVDIQDEYIEHAKSFRFPKGMLYQKPKWLRREFEATADPDWVVLNEDIQNAITIHPSQDLKTFKGNVPYDIIFINNLLYHLEIEESFYVLLNLLSQAKGLVCISKGGFFRSQNHVNGPAAPGIVDIFRQNGFVFARPNEKDIVPSDDTTNFCKHKATGGYIAIHDELLADMKCQSLSPLTI